MALVLNITPAGREALVNAEHNGTAPVTVVSVGVTPEFFSPGTTVIPGEIKRIETISGGVTAPDTIHVTVRDSSADTYTIRGLGLYLNDGTLFASYSQAGVIAEKSAQAVLLMAVDVQFADIDATQITFGDTNFNLNLATTETAGVVELATLAETRAGTDAQRAVTPADLAAARYAPGQIVVTAGRAALPGTLLCNGQAVSRSTYAALYAVIGDIYGAGDGSTTFNVPNIAEDTTIVNTAVPAMVGSYTPGALLKHTHAGSAAAVGDHTHYTVAESAGSHIHTASSDSAGVHLHAAWTETAGSHAHTGTALWNGDHSHNYGAISNRYATGGSQALHELGQYAAATSVNGAHGHDVTTVAAGNHAHSVGMNEAGSHNHAISIALAGGHTHVIEHRGAGAHTHTVTIGESGSAANLPAGLRMMCCIAF